MRVDGSESLSVPMECGGNRQRQAPGSQCNDDDGRTLAQLLDCNAHAVHEALVDLSMAAFAHEAHNLHAQYSMSTAQEHEAYPHLQCQ